jgi:hypothetical protein
MEIVRVQRVWPTKKYEVFGLKKMQRSYLFYPELIGALSTKHVLTPNSEPLSIMLNMGDSSRGPTCSELFSFTIHRSRRQTQHDHHHDARAHMATRSITAAA